jgi:hypothetical protein
MIIAVGDIAATLVDRPSGHCSENAHRRYTQ